MISEIVVGAASVDFAVGLGGGPVVHRVQPMGGGIKDVPWFFHMVDHEVSGVPGTRGVLLVATGTVAVVEVEQGVGGRGEAGDVDPGDEAAGGAAEQFEFMVELIAAVIGEHDVVSVGLRVCREVGI